jgi:hypothetical protein
VRRACVGGIAAAGAASLAFFAALTPTAGADTRAKDWKAASDRVDALVASRFKSQKDLVVAPRADDAEFLRRVTLDLTGIIPTEAETVAFLNDPAADKRTALVERLLASARHAEWFATWWSNLLAGTTLRDRNINRRTFNDWLRDQFRKNRPYDEMVYDLVTAQGNSDENGAVGFLSQFDRSAADAAGKTSRFFLGVQIQCAQCHDHPYDKRIKKEDFGTFAAFFMTTAVKRNQTPGNPEISFDVTSIEKDDLYGGRGRTGRQGANPMQRGPLMSLDPAKPGMAMMGVPDAKFLLGKTVKDVPGVSRRELLAKWMTSPNNEWFAQAFANRMWAYFLGHGIVHPTDDFSNTNKPSNPDLLKALGDEFAKSGFDLNHLVRVIVGTEAYQRTSKTPRSLERPDENLFAIAPVKPLTVEQSFDSFFRATGAEGEMERRLNRGGPGGKGAPGRGMLIDPKMAMYQLFRRVFDDDEGAESEEFTGTIPRGLLMMNGQEVNGMIARADGPLGRILQEEKGDRERIRRIYLTSLSREPSPGELTTALQHVHQSRTEREGYQDLLWGLLNTTEFMSNH